MISMNQMLSGQVPMPEDLTEEEQQQIVGAMMADDALTTIAGNEAGAEGEVNDVFFDPDIAGSNYPDIAKNALLNLMVGIQESSASGFRKVILSERNNSKIPRGISTEEDIVGGDPLAQLKKVVDANNLQIDVLKNQLDSEVIGKYNILINSELAGYGQETKYKSYSELLMADGVTPYMISQKNKSGVLGAAPIRKQAASIAEVIASKGMADPVFQQTGNTSDQTVRDFNRNILQRVQQHVNVDGIKAKREQLNSLVGTFILNQANNKGVYNTINSNKLIGGRDEIEVALAFEAMQKKSSELLYEMSPFYRAFAHIPKPSRLKKSRYSVFQDGYAYQDIPEGEDSYNKMKYSSYEKFAERREEKNQQVTDFFADVYKIGLYEAAGSGLATSMDTKAFLDTFMLDMNDDGQQDIINTAVGRKALSDIITMGEEALNKYKRPGLFLILNRNDVVWRPNQKTLDPDQLQKQFYKSEYNGHHAADREIFESIEDQYDAMGRSGGRTSAITNKVLLNAFSAPTKLNVIQKRYLTRGLMAVDDKYMQFMDMQEGMALFRYDSENPNAPYTHLQTVADYLKKATIIFPHNEMLSVSNRMSKKRSGVDGSKELVYKNADINFFDHVYSRAINKVFEFRERELNRPIIQLKKMMESQEVSYPDGPIISLNDSFPVKLFYERYGKPKALAAEVSKYSPQNYWLDRDFELLDEYFVSPQINRKFSFKDLNPNIRLSHFITDGQDARLKKEPVTRSKATTETLDEFKSKLAKRQQKFAGGEFLDPKGISGRATDQALAKVVALKESQQYAIDPLTGKKTLKTGVAKNEEGDVQLNMVKFDKDELKTKSLRTVYNLLKEHEGDIILYNQALKESKGVDNKGVLTLNMRETEGARTISTLKALIAGTLDKITGLRIKTALENSFDDRKLADIMLADMEIQTAKLTDEAAKFDAEYTPLEKFTKVYIPVYEQMLASNKMGPENQILKDKMTRFISDVSSARFKETYQKINKYSMMIFKTMTSKADQQTADIGELELRNPNSLSAKEKKILADFKAGKAATEKDDDEMGDDDDVYDDPEEEKAAALLKDDLDELDVKDRTNLNQLNYERRVVNNFIPSRFVPLPEEHYINRVSADMYNIKQQEEARAKTQIQQVLGKRHNTEKEREISFQKKIDDVEKKNREARLLGTADMQVEPQPQPQLNFKGDIQALEDVVAQKQRKRLTRNDEVPIANQQALDDIQRQDALAQQISLPSQVSMIIQVQPQVEQDYSNPAGVVLQYNPLPLIDQSNEEIKTKKVVPAIKPKGVFKRKARQIIDEDDEEEKDDTIQELESVSRPIQKEKKFNWKTGGGKTLRMKKAKELSSFLSKDKQNVNMANVSLLTNSQSLFEETQQVLDLAPRLDQVIAQVIPGYQIPSAAAADIPLQAPPLIEYQPFTFASNIVDDGQPIEYYFDEDSIPKDEMVGDNQKMPPPPEFSISKPQVIQEQKPRNEDLIMTIIQENKANQEEIKEAIQSVQQNTIAVQFQANDLPPEVPNIDLVKNKKNTLEVLTEAQRLQQNLMSTLMNVGNGTITEDQADSRLDSVMADAYRASNQIDMYKKAYERVITDTKTIIEEKKLEPPILNDLNVKVAATMDNLQQLEITQNQLIATADSLRAFQMEAEQQNQPDQKTSGKTVEEEKAEIDIVMQDNLVQLAEGDINTLREKENKIREKAGAVYMEYSKLSEEVFKNDTADNIEKLQAQVKEMEKLLKEAEEKIPTPAKYNSIKNQATKFIGKIEEMKKKSVEVGDEFIKMNDDLKKLEESKTYTEEDVDAYKEKIKLIKEMRKKLNDLHKDASDEVRKFSMDLADGKYDDLHRSLEKGLKKIQEFNALPANYKEKIESLHRLHSQLPAFKADIKDLQQKVAEIKKGEKKLFKGREVASRLETAITKTMSKFKENEIDETKLREVLIENAHEILNLKIDINSDNANEMNKQARFVKLSSGVVAMDGSFPNQKPLKEVSEAADLMLYHLQQLNKEAEQTLKVMKTNKTDTAISKIKYTNLQRAFQTALTEMRTKQIPERNARLPAEIQIPIPGPNATADEVETAYAMMRSTDQYENEMLSTAVDVINRNKKLIVDARNTKMQNEWAIKTKLEQLNRLRPDPNVQKVLDHYKNQRGLVSDGVTKATVEYFESTAQETQEANYESQERNTRLVEILQKTNQLVKINQDLLQEEKKHLTTYMTMFEEVKQHVPQLATVSVNMTQKPTKSEAEQIVTYLNNEINNTKTNINSTQTEIQIFAGQVATLKTELDLLGKRKKDAIVKVAELRDMIRDEDYFQKDPNFQDSIGGVKAEIGKIKNAAYEQEVNNTTLRMQFDKAAKYIAKINQEKEQVKLELVRAQTKLTEFNGAGNAVPITDKQTLENEVTKLKALRDLQVVESVKVEEKAKELQQILSQSVTEQKQMDTRLLLQAERLKREFYKGVDLTVPLTSLNRLMEETAKVRAHKEDLARQVVETQIAGDQLDFELREMQQQTGELKSKQQRELQIAARRSLELESALKIQQVSENLAQRTLLHKQILDSNDSRDRAKIAKAVGISSERLQERIGGVDDIAKTINDNWNRYSQKQQSIFLNLANARVKEQLQDSLNAGFTMWIDNVLVLNHMRADDLKPIADVWASTGQLIYEKFLQNLGLLATTFINEGDGQDYVNAAYDIEARFALQNEKTALVDKHISSQLFYQHMLTNFMQSSTFLKMMSDKRFEVFLYENGVNIRNYENFNRAQVSDIRLKELVNNKLNKFNSLNQELIGTLEAEVVGTNSMPLISEIDNIFKEINTHVDEMSSVRTKELMRVNIGSKVKQFVQQHMQGQPAVEALERSRRRDAAQVLMNQMGEKLIQLPIVSLLRDVTSQFRLRDGNRQNMSPEDIQRSYLDQTTEQFGQLLRDGGIYTREEQEANRLEYLGEYAEIYHDSVHQMIIKQATGVMKSIMQGVNSDMLHRIIRRNDDTADKIVQGNYLGRKMLESLKSKDLLLMDHIGKGAPEMLETFEKVKAKLLVYYNQDIPIERKTPDQQASRFVSGVQKRIGTQNNAYLGQWQPDRPNINMASAQDTLRSDLLRYTTKNRIDQRVSQLDPETLMKVRTETDTEIGQIESRLSGTSLYGVEEHSDFIQGAKPEYKERVIQMSIKAKFLNPANDRLLNRWSNGLTYSLAERGDRLSQRAYAILFANNLPTLTTMMATPLESAVTEGIRPTQEQMAQLYAYRDLVTQDIPQVIVELRAILSNRDEVKKYTDAQVADIRKTVRDFDKNMNLTEAVVDDLIEMGLATYRLTDENNRLMLDYERGLLQNREADLISQKKISDETGRLSSMFKRDLYSKMDQMGLRDFYQNDQQARQSINNAAQRPFHQPRNPGGGAPQGGGGGNRQQPGGFGNVGGGGGANQQQQQTSQGMERGKGGKSGIEGFSTKAIEMIQSLENLKKSDIEFIMRIRFDKERNMLLIVPEVKKSKDGDVEMDEQGGEPRPLTADEKRKFIRVICLVLVYLYIENVNDVSKEDRDEAMKHMKEKVGGKNFDPEYIRDSVNRMAEKVTQASANV